MMKRLMIAKTLAGLAVLLVLFLGCENPTGSDDTDDGAPTDPVETVDPPENLVGTIALGDGSSAVLDIQFTAASSSVTARTVAIGASATYTISGSVRYNETTYTASGSYDSATAGLTATASSSGQGSFSVDGTYSATEGLSGTVTFTPASGSAINGSVNAVGITDALRSSISIFVGTYGGSTYGSWNGTLSADRFYGTFAASDGSGERGTFSSAYADGEVSSGSAGSNTGDQVPFGGTLAEDGASIGGWWAGDVVEDGVTYPISGTWSGVKVDGNNDAPIVGAGSEGEVIANRFLQTLGSLLRIAEDLVESGTIADYEDAGATLVLYVGGSTDVIVRLTGAFDGEISEENFQGWTSARVTIDPEGDGYADTVTGITIGPGEIFAAYDTTRTVSSIREMTTLIIDDVATAPPGEESNDGGITLTFSDETSAVLYVNGTINDATDTVGGTWQYGPDSTDVKSFVQGALF
jgi:hypothetical protein